MAHLTQLISRTAIALACGFAVSAHAATNLVTNGSLTAAIANNGVPSGWSILLGSPDVMDGKNNVGVANTERFGAAPSGASPDGGTWVGLGVNTAQSYTERFGQTLTGLTVGQTYQVSWYEGNFGYSFGNTNYLGSNAIEVLLDGVSLAKGQTLALGSNWYSEAFSFVATSTSTQLAFQLAGMDKSYLSIDGIAVTTTATAPVPEPGTYAFMGLGLVGIALAARRRTAGQAQA